MRPAGRLGKYWPAGYKGPINWLQKQMRFSNTLLQGKLLENEKSLAPDYIKIREHKVKFIYGFIFISLKCIGGVQMPSFFFITPCFCYADIIQS